MNSNDNSQSVWRNVLRKNAFTIGALFPALTYVGIFFFVIIFYVLKLSFTTFAYNKPVDTATLANYAQVLQSAEVWEALWRTLVFVLITTPLQLITGLIMAMLIHRSFKGRGAVRSIFLLPLAIPAMVTTSTLLIMFSDSGHMVSLFRGEYIDWLNFLPQGFSFIGSSFWSMFLVVFGKVWRDTPISMLILLAGLQTIGKDQYEAALTMGCGAVKSFFYITIPLLMPSISSVLLLRSIEAWKEFIFALTLAPKYPLLGVLVDKYYIQLMNPGGAAVIGLLLIVCIMASAWIIKTILTNVQKYLVKV